MIEQAWGWIFVGGRVLFSLIFIVFGMMHFTKSKDMVGYATSRGAPVPALTVPLTGAMALLGGFAVLLGWHRYIGAGLIAIFALLTAFVMHNFWIETDPKSRQSELVHFLKNLSLAGGALFIAANSWQEWPMSLGAPGRQ